MAQWIRHRPTEPGIAGSSPAEVILLFHIVNSDDDYDDDDVKGKWNLRAMGMTMLDVQVHVTIVGDSLGSATHRHRLLRALPPPLAACSASF